MKFNIFWIAGIILFVIALSAGLSAKFEWNDEQYAFEQADSLNIEECHEEFGIDLGGFHVEKGKIQPGQFLADILLSYSIGYSEITELSEVSKTVFDIGKLIAGKNYTLVCDDNETHKAKFFIYEVSPIEYVVFDLRNPFKVYKQSRPVTISQDVASGVINSSLYQTLIEKNLSPALAMELADIYAWTIDFYRIQKGDFFKVVYTTKEIEGVVIGIDEVKAAIFSHYNNPYYAIQFQQGEQSDYFDENGMSLRKAFLQAPLKFSRITSGYTKQRFHPVQKRWKAHLGTDYAAPTGTPIMSIGDGVVIEAQYKQFNGNYVKIKHNATYTTQYLHMSKIASGIKPGAHVKQGQTIGFVGSTGLATGPHVCFRFWKNGNQVDHRNEKIEPSEPIKPEYKVMYEDYLKNIKSTLDSISLVENAQASF